MSQELRGLISEQIIDEIMETVGFSEYFEYGERAWTLASDCTPRKSGGT